MKRSAPAGRGASAGSHRASASPRGLPPRPPGLTVDPGNDHTLPERLPQQRDPAGRVVVKELEHVHAALPGRQHASPGLCRLPRTGTGTSTPARAQPCQHQCSSWHRHPACHRHPLCPQHPQDDGHPCGMGTSRAPTAPPLHGHPLLPWVQQPQGASGPRQGPEGGDVLGAGAQRGAGWPVSLPCPHLRDHGEVDEAADDAAERSGELAAQRASPRLREQVQDARDETLHTDKLWQKAGLSRDVPPRSLPVPVPPPATAPGCPAPARGA